MIQIQERFEADLHTRTTLFGKSMQLASCKTLASCSKNRLLCHLGACGKLTGQPAASLICSKPLRSALAPQSALHNNYKHKPQAKPRSHQSCYAFSSPQ